jgi:hypothetical protein
MEPANKITGTIPSPRRMDATNGKADGRVNLNVVIRCIPWRLSAELSEGEELLFRGALQTIFLRWIRNPHVAILLVAFIFSAIHMQFYGFFPRLALGLLFGYLFYWSNNLWIPIFAHLVNNGAVVINTFIYQRQGNELSSLELSVSIPTFTYYISAIVVIYALLAFRNHTNQLQNLSTTKQTIL